MFDKIIPKKIAYMFELIRVNKPIGFMLLMWPSWFGLANLDQPINELIKWYIYFFLGSFFMRSAGCIINDLIDIKIDKKIERTSLRPLASGKIKIFESLILLSLLLLISFLILMQFNFRAILLGAASIPIILLYPFLKRFTYWPQLGLGIVFNWGVFIVAIEFFDQIPFEYFFLYLGCVFWTLAYDTIYAYQDREDDIKINIKSTAVLLGNQGKTYVKIFYSLFLGFIGYIGLYSSQSYLSLIVIIAIIAAMYAYLNKWNPNSKNSCNHFFRFNNVVGFTCFIFLFIF